MRVLILLLFLVPSSLLAQKDESFAKFINEDGSVIRGSSVTKYFERQIPAFNLESNSSANSTIVRFTMEQEAAVGILRDILQTKKKIRSGEIAVTYLSAERRLVRYKISMENIAVEEGTDANGTVSIQLHATRIGWTYYSYSRGGLQTISSKNGWDEERRKAWTTF